MICGDKNYSLEQPDTCPACDVLYCVSTIYQVC